MSYTDIPWLLFDLPGLILNSSQRLSERPQAAFTTTSVSSFHISFSENLAIISVPDLIHVNSDVQ